MKPSTPCRTFCSPERVWVGNHLKVVRYRVTNNTGMARNIAESDFWQSGIRGVLFGEASRQLMARRPAGLHYQQRRCG
jgi:conjugal transfer pilus assembly protein TraK